MSAYIRIRQHRVSALRLRAATRTCHVAPAVSLAVRAFLSLSLSLSFSLSLSTWTCCVSSLFQCRERASERARERERGRERYVHQLCL
jgi:hypothetical protein